jgi:hypothetical protein
MYSLFNWAPKGNHFVFFLFFFFFLFLLILKINKNKNAIQSTFMFFPFLLYIYICKPYPDQNLLRPIAYLPLQVLTAKASLVSYFSSLSLEKKEFFFGFQLFFCENVSCGEASFFLLFLLEFKSFMTYGCRFNSFQSNLINLVAKDW